KARDPSHEVELGRVGQTQADRAQPDAVGADPHVILVEDLRDGVVLADIEHVVLREQAADGAVDEIDQRIRTRGGGAGHVAGSKPSMWSSFRVPDSSRRRLSGAGVLRRTQNLITERTWGSISADAPYGALRSADASDLIASCKPDLRE